MKSFITVLPKSGFADKIRVCRVSGGLLILRSFSGPFNLASGGLLAAPPLISNCSNLPFGTQGRSRRLESCLQEMRDKKRPQGPGAPQGPTRFHHYCCQKCTQGAGHGGGGAGGACACARVVPGTGGAHGPVGGTMGDVSPAAMVS